MAEELDRRTFISRGAKTAAGAAIVGSGAGGLLEACGSSGKTSAGTGTSTTTAGKPKPGGKLIMATEAEIDGFDPSKNRWDTTGVTYARTVYDPLAALTPEGKVEPYLAQSITPNADYTQWTITLRPNIKFHNGDPLDATVVKTNLDAVRAAALTGAGLTNVASVTVKDPMTVVVAMKEPWVPFDQYLAGYVGGQVAYMAHPKVFTDPNGSRNPIGTGPYVFKEWVPNDHFTATKNPNYWRPGLPYLDEITFKPIPDDQARGNGLRAGDIDLFHTSDTLPISQFRGNSSFNVIDDTDVTLGEPDSNFIMVNMADPVMSDIRIRQAMAMGLDQNKYISVMSNGITKPVTGLFKKGSPYYSDSGYPTYNPTKAKQLVDAYTKEKGHPPTFQAGTTNTPRSLEGAQLIQGMWQAVGIQSTITQVEQSQYILNALLGKYQAYGWRQFAASDPDVNYIWWSIPTAGAIGSLALNFARTKDPEIQAALEKGRTSTDPAVRARAYQTINQRFAQDLPYIFTDSTIWAIISNPRAKNINGPTLPGGGKRLGFFQGIVDVVEMWHA